MTKDHVVLVTGASSGIGLACALHLHQLGYRVFGASRSSDPPAGASFEWLQVDVDRDESVHDGVRRVVEWDGRIDVVINSAGFGIAGAIEDTSIEDARAQVETNFFGVVRVCQAVLPVMRQQRSGLIVNVSSLAGRVSVPFQGFYAASKFAVEGMTEALRMEMMPFGVRVVLVEPGDFSTKFTANRRISAESRSNPAYRERMRNALSTMERDEIHGPSPEAVARLVARILTTSSPRLRYTVGPLAERAAASLRPFLPQKLFEWLLMRYYRVL